MYVIIAFVKKNIYENYIYINIYKYICKYIYTYLASLQKFITKLKSQNLGLAKDQGTIGCTALTGSPWYLLCSLGILGDYSPCIPT